MLNLFNEDGSLSDEGKAFGRESTEKWKQERIDNALKPKFGRDSTFDEDILSLVKKYKGKPQEVLIRHMVDSLILFNHNRAQVDYVNTGDRFGDTEVWKAIQLQLHS